ncbi:hypothetical protein COY31_01340 [Candidatus Wolfebacteria bacterium CG_4_10_14_0_2_um_filter_39_18]|uniref:SEC-C domain-containing protein n=1 Tax=Candidatus Wolfebacteria bacterium CG_4_10_14_0_2_um_filter_39_18 TaxID=1975061 RepID=A0A2M7TG42_9BACT|nr:MAG: hypothetical protein COY31_01340 [Candidatus Wolfebacteria bacterium CG_4_10_14_0_2_um_filter_39_18]
MSSLYNFSQKEIDEVQIKFSKLKLDQQGVWKGIIDIYAEYEGYQINDAFEILIITPSIFPSQPPLMIEIGGRTQAIAKKYKITDLRRLHCNPSQRNTACLCVRQEEKEKFPPGSNLVVFTENLVVPYLYGLSYFEKFGKWPWGEYSHGGLGVLEYHAEDPTEITEQGIRENTKLLRADENWKEYSKQLRKPSSEKFCICGSRKPFRKCHKKAWQGLNRLYSDIHNFELNVRQLFQKQ